MGLSSNSLIHFTKKISDLEGILTDNFKLNYCYEKIEGKSDVNLLIPMVSFCDIPFSQVLKHIKSYGNYGIGLKKSWAKKNGLNPVLYIDKDSTLGQNFIFSLRSVAGKDIKKTTEFTETQKKVYDIIRYLKNYEGDLIREGKKTIYNYRFSDEREWRYILPINNLSLMFGNISTIKNDSSKIKEAKKTLNNKIESERLNFEPNDISYIIVQKESERDKIIKTLEHIKGRYPHNEVKRLTSRIISTEQINTDF